MLSNHRVAASLAIGTPIGFAALGGTLPGDGLTTWYPSLRKSKLVLPLWAFAPVAVLYYLMCGLILYRLLVRVKASHSQRLALALLLTVMAANEGWNYLLFGRRSTQAGLWGMLVFTGLTTALFRLLRQVDQQSAALIQAYLVWLGYDVVYAFELWRLNRE
jgi:translocator protein